MTGKISKQPAPPCANSIRSRCSEFPNDYTVYHGVHWTRIDEGFSVFGEADFVVVAPSGRVLVIEQKAGFLRETPPA